MFDIKSTLRPLKHEIERLFSLRPMQKVLNNLESKGYDVKSMNELELFGGRGDIHLVDVYRNVKSIKVWEYDSELVNVLKKRFKKADVHCVDTYASIKEENHKYDLVISDNPMQTEAGHIEHFDLFPHILNLLKDKSVMIISIIPNPTSGHLSYYPKLLNDRHQKARSDFYKCNDPTNIKSDEFKAAFAQQLRNEGLEMPWSFIQKRNNLLSYFVCGIEKTNND